MIIVGNKRYGSHILDSAGSWELLHLLPGLDEVPVREVLLQVLRVGGRGPVDEVEVDVRNAERLERGGDAILHTVVPGVVQLGGDPDLLSGHTRLLDALTDLALVAVGKGGIDVAVAGLERSLDGLLDLVGLGLPGSEADGRDLVTLRGTLVDVLIRFRKIIVCLELILPC